MNDTTSADTESNTSPAVDPPADAADTAKAPASPASSSSGDAKPTRQRGRAVGSGAMGARIADDMPAAQRQALDRAAGEARSTGRRFDLMRYLRLRRKQSTP